MRGLAMTRAEHMQWCKDRALEYVATGDLDEAMASMLSDLGKHAETQQHPAGQLMLEMRTTGHLATAHEMQEFINGFN